MLILLMPKLAIYVATLQQFLVPADVVNAALLKNQNGVGCDQGGQSVGDDDQGTAMRNARNVRVDDGLALGVERAGRLVEDKNTGVGNQGPRNCQPLTLSAREVGGAFVNVGFVAARQSVDEFLSPGHSGSANHFVERGIRLGGCNIFPNGAAE